MGQENITCCCKGKEKNEMEFDNINRIIENYDNFESIQSPIESVNNIKNLKNYVNTKNTSSLVKDDTSLSVKDEDDKILKSIKKQTKILSLRKKNPENNNSLFNIKNNKQKILNKIKFNLLENEKKNDKEEEIIEIEDEKEEKKEEEKERDKNKSFKKKKINKK